MKSALLITIFSVFSAYQFSGNWTADATKAKIEFSVDGPFGTVHGSFSGLKSAFQFDEKDLSANTLKASVDANTVSSGVGLRNTHLRNEDQWLNTKKYPEISFTSKKFEKTSSGFKVSGELSMKGITKAIEIPFTFSSTGDAGIFKGSFQIKREDYNLGKKGGSVGDVITIHIDVPVKK